MATEELIESFKKVHGNKYDYSKVEYVNAKTKVCIICPIHGEFLQAPHKHLNGQGCPKCRYIKSGKKNTKSTNNFISDAKKIHGNKYDYSKVIYKNNHSKVCIICPIHGEFWQTPMAHLNNQGCKKCAIEEKSKNQRKTTEQFIKEAQRIHNNKYNYSKTVYTNNKTKVCIICPIHGEFWQSPEKHLKGQGCKECAITNRIQNNIMSNDIFIAKARKIHGNKYDYSKVNYVNYYTKVCIICKEHGEFWQTPDSHLQGSGCQQCSHKYSKNEIEIQKFLINKIGENNIICNDRELLKPKELDIVIPSKKIAIEYNGLRWHSELFNKKKDYHINKLIECNNKDYSLIQIFEDEYIEKKEIVLHKLTHILNIDNNLPKIMGRKCKIEEINKDVAMDFINKFHIQGYSKSTINLGATYNNKLIAVMSFIICKSDKWELCRFATDYNYICQGVGGKLFNFFIKKYKPTEIKSFADRRWTINKNENLYTKLGFKIDKIIPPDYYYYDDKSKIIQRIHKFNCRKKILNKKYNLPLALSETEMTKKLSLVKIWNCGLLKFVWKK